VTTAAAAVATACVFVGPTLRSESVRSACEAVCLPPVAQGDVFRAVRMLQPRAIGIVDGYFEGAPSVWHKEILWAMTQGVHVFGSASMGALRAAELHAFGMRGIGRIFEAYRDGELEDDDEVAVVHGPPETGFVALSEPMVGIRATLKRAEEERIVAAATRRRLEELAKRRFYAERSWDVLLAEAEAEGVPAGETDALRRWLPQGKVDRKRDDALAMLAAMRELLATDPPPFRTTYHFEWTALWDEAVAGGASEPRRAWLRDDDLLDELRLEGDDAFRQATRAALLRELALREADRRRLEVCGDAVRQTINRFRTERGLFARADLDAWLRANRVDAAELERLLEDEARLDALEARVDPTRDSSLLDGLRLSGDYARLAERARDKRRALAALGLEDPDPRAFGLTPAALRLWYFEKRLGRSVPEDVEDYARRLGCPSRGDFDRMLVREYLYSYRLGGSTGI
jgi:hypothetical protein